MRLDFEKAVSKRKKKFEYGSPRSSVYFCPKTHGGIMHIIRESIEISVVYLTHGMIGRQCAMSGVMAVSPSFSVRNLLYTHTRK